MRFLVEFGCLRRAWRSVRRHSRDTGSLEPSATLDRQGEQAGRISIPASAARSFARSRAAAAAVALDRDPASEHDGKKGTDQEYGQAQTSQTE
jgi:hypothetical protein